ncbi:F-box protein At5g03970-like [Olea europaea var. sylvestris]|uniref:F-box protein At5g03970-like n=1 Tax=Olea europaea var. sylvestris TaxID=158386 RepID=UPI000C1D2197|nr:F-box protein At5g03970-like [Olea europaea var. sylvestris]
MTPNIQDDVLREILVRLPPKFVFKFRCVSKRWNEIIQDSYFLRSYACGRKGSRDQLLGFILRAYKYPYPNTRPRSEPRIKVLPLHGKRIGAFPEKVGYFISSSNGLVLCGHHHPMKYYVINPLTQKWVSLPRPCNHYKEVSMGLVCEENTAQLVAKYKVVRTGKPAMLLDNRITIETYSSTTGKWVESVLVATDKFCVYPWPFIAPFVLNGVFHWVASPNFVVLYDPNENHLQLIENPINEMVRQSSVYSRSSDGLLWCGILTEFNLRIWMLPKSDQGYKRSCTIPKEEWVLVHGVTFESLCNDYSMIRDTRLRPETHSSKFYSLVFSSWNPLIVLFRIGETVFVYNIPSKSVELLSYRGKPPIDYGGEYIWHPHFETHFLSSYSLQ